MGNTPNIKGPKGIRRREPTDGAESGQEETTSDDGSSDEKDIPDEIKERFALLKDSLGFIGRKGYWRNADMAAAKLAAEVAGRIAHDQAAEAQLHTVHREIAKSCDDWYKKYGPTEKRNQFACSLIKAIYSAATAYFASPLNNDWAKSLPRQTNIITFRYLCNDSATMFAIYDALCSMGKLYLMRVGPVLKAASTAATSDDRAMDSAKLQARVVDLETLVLCVDMENKERDEKLAALTIEVAGLRADLTAQGEELRTVKQGFESTKAAKPSTGVSKRAVSPSATRSAAKRAALLRISSGSVKLSSLGLGRNEPK